MAKHKAPVITEEDRIAEMLKDIRKSRINEPTMSFKVGERVTYGSLDRAIVDEILDNGKIIKIKIWHKNGPNTQRSGEVVHDGSIIYAVWHELTPYRTNEENKAIEVMHFEDDVHINFMQAGIDSLFDYYYRNNLNMNPDYQRGDVWELNRKVRLIDSIFNNVEIGRFVLVFTGYTGDSHYEILDGKQRLTALTEFYEGRFKYRGKTFYDLNWRDQSHFERYKISYARTENPMTDEQKYKYFLKLNTFGVEQDPAHIEYVKNLLRNKNV
ncbi:putative DUF262 domain-containing protein [Azospirillaceae bacterium]